MIAENFKIVADKVAERCVKCGRSTSEVTIIAVSKTQPLSSIRSAFSYGIIDFGENKAQELRDKYAELKIEANWHFIGHLQTNKVKYVIEPAKLIHSVDSVKLAEGVNRKAEAAGLVKEILFEVNTSGEESKFGLQSGEDVLKLLEFCNNLGSIRVKGLMTMAPYTDNEFVIRSCFSGLRKALEKVNSYGFNLTELSMGMTNDYELAVEEGATLLRIGTAIFGERNYAV